MSEVAVIIKCPKCKEPMAITKSALVDWDDDAYYPICSEGGCNTGIHFEDLTKTKLVELLRLLSK